MTVSSGECMDTMVRKQSGWKLYNMNPRKLNQIAMFYQMCISAPFMAGNQSK